MDKYPLHMEPPFFIKYIVLPMARLLLPKKLSSRIQTVARVEDLGLYFDADQLCSEYGGSAPDVDVDNLWKVMTDVYSGREEG
eukprot:g18790.t1